MKAAGVSSKLVQNDLPAERREKAGESGDAFSALLKTERSPANQFSTFPEALSGPVCSSCCSDAPVLEVMDCGKAAGVYQHNAVFFHPEQSALTAPEGGPAVVEGGKTPVQPAGEGSLPPELTGDLAQVMREIKGFFGRLFSPQSPPSKAPPPVAPKAAAEEPSSNTIAGFFRRLGTVLSFGYWRPEERQESGKAAEDIATRASNAGGDSSGGARQVIGASGPDLTMGLEAAARSEEARAGKNITLKVPAKIQEAIEEAARKYDLSPDLIAAVIKVESNFNAAAVSKEGAGGLMQLMPSTARALKVRNRFDVQQNIDGGSRYLKSLLERFDGRVELALAAYNVGPEAVKRHDGVPPYRHTRHYVKKVLAYC